MRPGIVEEASDHAIEAIDFFENDADELSRRRIVRRRADLNFFEKLSGSLDRTERIFYLVRQARGHRSEGGEAVTLLHSPVDPAVGNGHTDLCGHGLEQRDLFGGEGVAHAIVRYADDANE